MVLPQKEVKKGGWGGGVPLGEVNPPPHLWWSATCWTGILSYPHYPSSFVFFKLLRQDLAECGMSHTSFFLPKRSAHSARPPQKLRKVVPFSDQNFVLFLDRFLTSFRSQNGFQNELLFITFGIQNREKTVPGEKNMIFMKT